MDPKEGFKGHQSIITHNIRRFLTWFHRWSTLLFRLPALPRGEAISLQFAEPLCALSQKPFRLQSDGAAQVLTAHRSLSLPIHRIFFNFYFIAYLLRCAGESMKGPAELFGIVGAVSGGETGSQETIHGDMGNVRFQLCSSWKW